MILLNNDFFMCSAVLLDQFSFMINRILIIFESILDHHENRKQADNFERIFLLKEIQIFKYVISIF